LGFGYWVLFGVWGLVIGYYLMFGIWLLDIIWVLGFGYWVLFGVWGLVIGYYLGIGIWLLEFNEWRHHLFSRLWTKHQPSKNTM
jgi:hypothetical protein